MKILLLNGPPRSGKDTIAKHLYYKYKDHHNVTQFVFERFSAPLKTSFSAISGTTHNHFLENITYEQIKDEHISWLGCSYRQYQINLSEKHFKPLYGEDIFGRLFNKRLEGYDKDAVVVVPDSGFAIEIDVLEKIFKPTDILLVRCHRPGFDFTGDSRSYVDSKYFQSLDINNLSSAEDLERKGSNIFEVFLSNRLLLQYNETVK